MDGVNINKIKRLFSVTIAFKIRLKGTRFYGKIALLTSDQDSVIKIFSIVERRNKMGESTGNAFAGT